MILYRLARVIESSCEFLAGLCFDLGDLFLSGMRRAREWQPRLWQRDRDPRSEAEERRP